MVYLLVLGVVCLVVYEVWAAVTKRGPTISQLIWGLSRKSPIVPFLMGLLMGHLFARMVM